MRPRILVLGAGFGGLELSTLLSETLGDTVEVTLIDKSDHFIFGFSKLDVMFGHAEAHAVRLPYKNFTKPGVRMLQQAITSIDPAKRRVTTDKGEFEADYLVVALGAEYDFTATPGLADVTEFYSEAGVAKMRDVLPKFTRGRALIGVCGAPYKCSPAPSECANAARLSSEAGCAPGLRDRFRAPAAGPRATFAGNLARFGRGVHPA